MSGATRPVLIAGGGPVGSVFALALSQSGVAVTLVDDSVVEFDCDSNVVSAQSTDPVLKPRPADNRPIALSASSARILQTLGIWQAIAPCACPIQMVHVCEQGQFGAVRMRAAEHGVPALGYVADAATIAAALAPAVAQAERIECLRSTRVREVLAAPYQLRAKLDMRDGREEVRAAQLLVVADGGHSSLCADLGIASEHRDYQQMAVVCTVKPGHAHCGVAYERFTGRGPLALLPLVGGDCALVWTLPHGQAEEVAALDDVGFVQALQAAFGQRLGRLRTPTPRTVFPLSLVRAQRLNTARVVLIGNAANRLHPVAGQGLNLGLRDAAILADLVAQATRAGEDPGGDDLLQAYVRRRRAEHQGIVSFTDALACGFSAGPHWLGWLRGAGMLALDLLPLARHVLARHAMGLGAPQARLVRGLKP